MTVGRPGVVRALPNPSTATYEQALRLIDRFGGKSEAKAALQELRDYRSELDGAHAEALEAKKAADTAIEHSELLDAGLEEKRAELAAEERRLAEANAKWQRDEVALGVAQKELAKREFAVAEREQKAAETEADLAERLKAIEDNIAETEKRLAAAKKREEEAARLKDEAEGRLERIAALGRGE